MVFWNPWTGLEIPQRSSTRAKGVTSEEINEQFFDLIHSFPANLKRVFIGITDFIKDKLRIESIVITEINQQIVSGSLSGIPQEAVNLRARIFQRRTSINEFDKLVKKYKRLYPNFPISESTLDIVRDLIERRKKAEEKKQEKIEKDKKFIEKELKKFNERGKEKKIKKKKKISGRKPKDQKPVGVRTKRKPEIGRSNLNINFLASTINTNILRTIRPNISRNMLKRMEENLI